MKLFFYNWDRTNNRICDQSGQALDAGAFRWYRGDTFGFCFTCKKFDPATNTWVAEVIPATSTLQLMLKLGRFKSGDQDGTTQLAFTDADGFDTGIWSEAAAGSEKHSAVLALTEANLATLLTITSAPISPILEITETLQGGEQNTVEQQVTIYPDINRGGSTTTVQPDYWTGAQVAAAIAAAIAAKLNIAAGKRLVIEADGNMSVEDVT